MILARELVKSLLRIVSNAAGERLALRVVEHGRLAQRLRSISSFGPTLKRNTLRDPFHEPRI